MKVLILNCDLDRNPRTNGAAIIKRMLGKKARIETFNVYQNKFPPSAKLASYSCAIITGSKAAAYEKKAWIKKLKGTTVKIDKLGIPTLGICFGFQIVAEALGGKVVKGKGFTEGFKKIKIEEGQGNNLLFAGLKKQFKAYEAHGDILKKAPPGSVFLAKKGASKEAYQLRQFYCVQFHPEILPDTAIVMAKRDRKRISLILNGQKNEKSSKATILNNFIASFT